MLLARSLPDSVNALNCNARCPDPLRANGREGATPRNLVPSVQLDPASPQSLGKVKDDVTKPLPSAIGSCPHCRLGPGLHWVGCPLYPSKPPRVSTNVRAAIHETEDGGSWTIQIAQTVCPPERTC
jgi:hypothetical protein